MKKILRYPEDRWPLAYTGPIVLAIFNVARLGYDQHELPEFHRQLRDRIPAELR